MVAKATEVVVGGAARATRIELGTRCLSRLHWRRAMDEARAVETAVGAAVGAAARAVAAAVATAGGVMAMVAATT